MRCIEGADSIIPKFNSPSLHRLQFIRTFISDNEIKAKKKEKKNIIESDTSFARASLVKISSLLSLCYFCSIEIGINRRREGINKVSSVAANLLSSAVEV